MLDELAFLVNGYDGIANRRSKFKWLCRMFEVCKERPVRLNGQKASAELLHTHLLIRLCNLRLECFKEEVNEILGALRDYDEELYYFVVVATYRLSDEDLRSSLEKFSEKKWQYIHNLPNSATTGIFPVPQLPWDISPALSADIAIPDVTREEPIEPHDIRPIDARGMLTEQYSALLSSDILRIAEERPGPSCEFLCFDEEAGMTALIEMFDGVSSDLFQENNGEFTAANNLKLDGWSVARTQAVMNTEVEAANRIHHYYRSINDLSANHVSKNFSELISTAVENMKTLFKERLLSCSIREDPICVRIEKLHDIVEDQTQVLTVCNETLSFEKVQVTSLVFTLRCLKDSTSSCHEHLRECYEILLKEIINFAAVCIGSFVNTGRCDFSDNVFVECVAAKLSPDRTVYGEMWESNFGIDLPPSPDLNPRLCRMVVKQGVLVRLLNIDIVTAHGSTDLCTLYNVTSTDDEDCMNTEMARILDEIEQKFLNKILPTTLEDIVEWVVSNSPMYKRCCLVASAILRDVRSMCDVIRYLVLSAGAANLDTEHSKSLHMQRLRAELEARHFDRRHISAIDIVTESGTKLILITPPEPLSIIITAGHGRRYVRIYTFLTDLTRAAFALNDVELRIPSISPESSRQLFYCCSAMLRVITGARDHVIAELDSVWRHFLSELDSVTTIDQAINSHRRAMKSMMQRTLLDVSNLTTGRTVEVMCESCVRFAQAMNSGDEASAFIHYRVFDDHAQLLREKLSVERTNIYARTLLWRIGSDGDFFETEEENTLFDYSSQLLSKASTFRSLRELSQSASQLIF